MYRTTLRTAFAALLVAACAVPTLAQDWTGRGRLFGSVLDEKGKPIVGASVVLRPQATPETGPDPVITDKRGKFRLLGLAAGVWVARAEADGYAPFELELRVRETELNKPLEFRLVEQAVAIERENPGFAEAQAALARGNELLDAGDAQAALAEFEKGLSKVEGENRITFLRAVAEAQMRGGLNEEAVATYKSLLEIVGDDPVILSNLVDRLTFLKREDEAAVYMARMPEGAGLDPNTLVNMGINLYNEGKYPEALAKFEDALGQKPDYANAYYFRGLCRLATGEMAPAKEDFERYLGIEPDGKYAADAKNFIASL